MTTEEVSQIDAISLGKGRLDQLFRERRVHLLAWTSDLQWQMTIAVAHDNMEDSHCMASLSSAFYAWKELIWVHVEARHSRTRSSWLRIT